MLYYVGTAVFSPSIFGKQVVTDIFVRRFDALTFSKFSEFSESVKSNLSNYTINRTVEQVIIRAYLLIFDRVLSLRSHFVAFFSEFVCIS